MSKAEIGDLIVWSAQSRSSPMKFGIVYGFDINGIPMVHTEVERYVDGGWVKKIGKAAASSNYLVIYREGLAYWDDRISEAIERWIDWKDEGK